MCVLVWYVLSLNGICLDSVFFLNLFLKESERKKNRKLGELGDKKDLKVVERERKYDQDILYEKLD